MSGKVEETEKKENYTPHAKKRICLWGKSHAPIQ